MHNSNGNSSAIKVLDDCTAPYGTDVDEAGSTTYQMQVVNTTGKETMIVVYEDNHVGTKL